MKILEPIEELPFGASERYKLVWEKVRTLINPQWLPVECDNRSQAEYLRSQAKRRVRNLEAIRKGKIVYIRRKITPASDWQPGFTR